MHHTYGPSRKEEMFLDMLQRMRQKAREEEIAEEKAILEGEKIGLRTWIEEGMEKGEKIGLRTWIEEGMEKGEKIGLQIGIEKGIKNGIEKVAKRMIDRGMSMSDIAELTGLSPDKVKSLADEFNKKKI